MLHGLARSSRSMRMIEKGLKNAGYATINCNYPSTRDSIDRLAMDTLNRCLKFSQHYSKIHFVTHSLGGILLRHYLSKRTIKNMGRVVMLGPPNKGSQVVDKLKNIPGFKLINGPAGMQLGTNDLSVPNMLGPATFELGIIAGKRSVNLILSTLIPGQDDGKVSVKNTMLDGMSDHLVLPVTHTFMMNSRKVIHQIKAFLRSGQFDRS